MSVASGVRRSFDIMGIAILVAAGWTFVETHGASSLQGIEIFATAIQSRCDLDFIRVRAAAGTKDLMGKEVPVILIVAGGEPFILTGRSVRLGDQPERWLGVEVGGRSGWVRDDVVEPIQVCDSQGPRSSAS